MAEKTKRLSKKKAALELEEESTPPPPQKEAKKPVEKVKKDTKITPNNNEDMDIFGDQLADILQTTTAPQKDLPVAVVATPKTAQEPTPKKKEMNVFYCKDHYWEDACSPHTLVVAEDLQKASAILQEELAKVFPSTKPQQFNFTKLPLDGPGVAILSIGLGQLTLANKNYSVRPIKKDYKSEGNMAEWKLFYCNSHYSSSTTAPASVILAKDRSEAALFLLQLLSEIGTPESRDTMIYPIDMLQPSVYFLGRGPVTLTEEIYTPPVVVSRQKKLQSESDSEEMEYNSPHRIRKGSLSERLGFSAIPTIPLNRQY